MPSRHQAGATVKFTRIRKIGGTRPIVSVFGSLGLFPWPGLVVVVVVVTHNCPCSFEPGGHIGDTKRHIGGLYWS